jgi:hypothetical protein
VRNCTFTLSALLLTACASHQAELAATAPSSDAADMDEPIAEVLTVSADELNDGRTCEFRRLPGSRIAFRQCSAHDAYMAARQQENVEERVELMRQMRYNQQRMEIQRMEEQEKAAMYLMTGN